MGRTALQTIEEAVERSTGKSIEEIRNTPLCEMLGKPGKRPRLVSSQPDLISHEQVERDLDQALKK